MVGFMNRLAYDEPGNRIRSFLEQEPKSALEKGSDVRHTTGSSHIAINCEDNSLLIR